MDAPIAGRNGVGMLWKIVCALAVAGAVSAGAGAVPVCEFEDSQNCVWIASDRGNGGGRSFVDVAGVAFYLDGSGVPA